jgi:hypothetical protein
MADCCLSAAQKKVGDAISKSTGAMPLDKKFDGSSVNDNEFEGAYPPNVSTK